MGFNINISNDNYPQITAYRGIFESLTALKIKQSLGKSGYFAFLNDLKTFAYWDIDINEWQLLNLGVNINPNDIVDNLTSNDASKALSAKQGSAIKTYIDIILDPNIEDTFFD